METVRQAHLPGNYELCDEEAGVLGSAICKRCWETAKMTNSVSLDTVWLSSSDQSAVWWLCKGHHQSLAVDFPSFQLIRNETRVVRYPEVLH